MQYGLRRYSSNGRSDLTVIPKRVQGYHSHLPPRERFAQERLAINSSFGENHGTTSGAK
jgi:hypothetical protein